MNEEEMSQSYAHSRDKKVLQRDEMLLRDAIRTIEQMDYLDEFADEGLRWIKDSLNSWVGWRKRLALKGFIEI